jgi:hypothetical protein
MKKTTWKTRNKKVQQLSGYAHFRDGDPDLDPAARGSSQLAVAMPPRSSPTHIIEAVEDALRRTLPARVLPGDRVHVDVRVDAHVDLVTRVRFEPVPVERHAATLNGRPFPRRS